MTNQSKYIIRWSYRLGDLLWAKLERRWIRHRRDGDTSFTIFHRFLWRVVLIKSGYFKGKREFKDRKYYA